ncbi:Trp family transcriptional regulator [Amedibacillus dolichus]|uniref:Trp family transcriptional regulator n=1 Tax=Amedibacillus dolichus TaxID=31971 RepID=A0ABT7UCV2_9FIRM|nr:Trp family transcriptional regulator [Amedibacillus dolichus]MDM8157458.1 Trp family transcriptional regulator [Amedibacillus dolichus]
MGFNLMTVFSAKDLQKFGQQAANVIQLTFKPNKKTGARMARAVMDNGITLVKTVTASGTVLEEVIRLPEITTIAQRNNVIRDLARNKMTQEQIAAMLDISQATVSNVLRKK